MVWSWVSWVANGCGRGWVSGGVAIGFRWVSGEVSWVADGCGRGSQVRLEWLTEGSRWLRFGGFFATGGGGWQWLVTGC